MALAIKKIASLIVVFIMSFTSFQAKLFPQKTDDITVLYTNDVHCSIDENIGYSGIVAYKNEVQKKCRNVTLVDVGDAIQGGVVGAVSQGEYITEIMNYVGYDFAVLGNHEFDYGMQNLSSRISESDFTYLGCNLTYSGTGKNLLEAVEPYAIVDYGNTSVAFIGVTTPYSTVTSTPKNFQDENGNYIYGFESDLYTCVQKYVLKARLRGADYVVVLSHLGDTAEYDPYSSTALIQNTVGIDAVLDGHAHNTIESITVSNERGDDVILSSTGTELNNIGQLTISSKGEITTTLVSDYSKKDKDTDSFIASIKEKYENALNTVIGKCEETLSIYEDGIRMVRIRETTVGNFVADAYREIMNADIAFCNGGGVRTDINAGEITYGDMFNVNPFGNRICVVEATGAQILDFLEMCSNRVSSEIVEDGLANGEYGGFAQVSGLKYKIDTSVPTPVKLDPDYFFEGIEGKRRVYDVYVLENGKYVPIDKNKTYTVAGSEYMLLNMGDGNNVLSKCNVVSADGLLDYEVLMTYVINYLNGVIPASYAKLEGRIEVK